MEKIAVINPKAGFFKKNSSDFKTDQYDSPFFVVLIITFEKKVQRGNKQQQQQKWWGGITDNELFNGPQLKK